MPRTAKSLAWNAVLKGYVESDKINSVSEGAECLFLRLLMKSDDEGRFRGSARAVLSALYLERWERGDIDEADVESRLRELEDVGLVKRYVVDGRVYVQVIDVFRAGGDRRTRVVEHPSPEEGTAYKPQEQSQTGPRSTASAFGAMQVHECTETPRVSRRTCTDSGASTHHRTQEHKNEELNSSSSTTCQLFPRARPAPSGSSMEEEDRVPSRGRSAAC